MARIIGEFESSVDTNKRQICGTMNRTCIPSVFFFRDVKSLINAIEDMGNPFCDNSNDSLTLDNSTIADQVVIDRVRNVEQLGKDQYTIFVEERLVSQTKHILDPINKNNLLLFKQSPAREKSRTQQEVSSLKNDCFMFSRLYDACQTRDDEFRQLFTA